MKYKKNLDQAVDRNRELWSGSNSSLVLAKIEVTGSSAFDTWIDVLSPEICPDPARMFARFCENFEARAELLDDGIPTARPSFGSSSYGAFFGAEMRFGRSGGYSKPLRMPLKDHRKLQWDFETGWLRRQLDAARYFCKHSRGLCGVSIIETMDNLNLGENLFGSDVYIQLIDDPRELSTFFDLALEFNIALVEKQREHIPRHRGGYFDIHEIWVPGETVWLSIDAWNLVGREHFRDLGLPHIQKCIDHFGSAWLHMHNQAMHLLPAVMNLKGLVGIALLDDPGEPRCFPRLRQIKETTRDMPLQINCSKAELLAGLKAGTLDRNVMYWVDSGIDSVEEANRIMEMVRSY